MGTIKPQNPVLNRSHPFTQGLVACLPFHEGVGETTHDVTYFRNDATIDGASWEASTPSVQFDGTNTQAFIPNSDDLNFGSDPFSVVVRFKLDEEPTENNYVVSQINEANEGWGISVVTDLSAANVAFTVGDGTNGTYYVNNTVDLEVGEWCDVVASKYKDGTDDHVRLSVNGITLGIGVESSVDSVDNTNDVVLGGSDFQGSIEFFSLYDRVVTDIEAREFSDNPYDIFRTHEPPVSLILGSQEISETGWDTVLSDGEWHHVAIVRNAESNTAELYVDTTSQGTVPVDLSRLNVEGLVIGQDQDRATSGLDYNENFEDQMDEFMIFNRALSAAEIEILYNDGELPDATTDTTYYHSPPVGGGISVSGLATNTAIYTIEELRIYEAAYIINPSVVTSHQSAGEHGGATLGESGHYYTLFIKETNGGSAVSGQAEASLFSVNEVSGGTQVDGTAYEGRALFETGGGGSLVDGNTTPSIGSANPVTVLVNGSAVVTVNLQTINSGGTTVDGQAITSIGLIVEGGVLADGAAVTGFSYQEQMSGGLTTSGIAHEDTPGRYFEIGSGGAAVHGSSHLTSVETRFASGGASSSGVISHNLIIDTQTSGTVLISGESVLLIERFMPVEGGIAVNGVALESFFPSVYETTGGSIVGGSAEESFLFNIFTSSGAQLHGSIDINSTMLLPADGGVTTSGQPVLGINIAVGGTVIVSGQAKEEFYDAIDGSGGGTVGGDNINFVEILVGGTILTGGEATIEIIGDRYWVGDGTNTDWDNVNNWSSQSGGVSGVSVPTQEHHVHYDSGASGDCIVDIDATTRSIEFNGYTGNFDAATYDINVDEALNIANGDVDLGSGTWSVGGDLTLGSSNITYGTSIIDLDGTSTISMPTVRELYSIHVTGEATYSSVYTLTLRGDLDVDGTLEIASGTIEICGTPSSDKTLKASGTITGAGTLRIGEHADAIDVDSTAVWDNDTVHFKFDHQIAARTWINDSVVFDLTTGDQIIQFLDGTHTFQGDVSFNSWEDGTFDMASHNPNFAFYGDVSRSHYSTAPTWDRGTGQIRFLGYSNQLVDFNGFSVENWYINKFGGSVVTLDTDATAYGIDVLTGGLNVNGNTLRSTDMFRIQEQADLVKSGLNGATINVDGNAFLYGKTNELMDLDTSTDWIYNVGGIGTAFYVNAGNSNASGGSTIYAYLSTDAGDTQNWVFAEYLIIEAGGGGKLGGSYEISTDHVWALAYCDDDEEYNCHIKQQDEYCITAASSYYRNRGTPLLHKNAEELIPQIMCGTNYNQITSDCSVALVAPIIFCRRSNELKVLSDELTHTEDQYRAYVPELAEEAEISMQSLAMMPKDPWKIITNIPFKPLSIGEPVKHAPPKWEKPKSNSRVAEHLLTPAELRKKYANNYETLKKPAPSIEKSAPTLVTPKTPQMTTLHRDNARLRKKNVAPAPPSIPTENWDTLKKKKAAKRIRPSKQSNGRKVTQAL